MFDKDSIASMASLSCLYHRAFCKSISFLLYSLFLGRQTQIWKWTFYVMAKCARTTRLLQKQALVRLFFPFDSKKVFLLLVSFNVFWSLNGNSGLTDVFSVFFFVFFKYTIEGEKNAWLLVVRLYLCCFCLNFLALEKWSPLTKV